MLKPLILRITTNCRKFLKRWEYQNTLLASQETYIQVKKQQLEPDMEQQTVSILWKEYVKAVYCHPTYLIFMQSTSWETLGWMKHKLESRLPGDISVTSDMQIDSSLMAEEEIKNLLMNMKEDSEKTGLKLTFNKQWSWHQVPSLHGKQMRTMGTVRDFTFLGSKIIVDDDSSHEIKMLTPWKKLLDNILKSRAITLPTNVHIV